MSKEINAGNAARGARRSMTGRLSRLLIPIAMTVALNLTGVLASAGTSWCEEDPIYSFNGHNVDVTTGFDSAYLGTISGPILFELELPANAPQALAIGVAIRVPQEVRISYTLPAWDGVGAIPAITYVTVPAGADFETQTRVTGTSSIVAIVNGRSNQRIVIPLRFTLP